MSPIPDTDLVSNDHHSLRDNDHNDPSSDARPPQCDPTSTFTRHSILWFSDGSIVLRAEQTLFRVHVSQLALHSSFFRTLFTLPQPYSDKVPLTDIPSQYVPDGCLALRVYDTAEDVANFLTAIYLGPTFGTNDPADFRVQAGILRLSHKYEVEKLREKALAHISTAWPSSLKAWDTREEVARSFETASKKHRRERYPSPIVRALVSYGRLRGCL